VEPNYSAGVGNLFLVAGQKQNLQGYDGPY